LAIFQEVIREGGGKSKGADKSGGIVSISIYGLGVSKQVVEGEKRRRAAEDLVPLSKDKKRNVSRSCLNIIYGIYLA